MECHWTPLDYAFAIWLGGISAGNTLQKHRHIQWQMPDPILFHHVLSVEDIGHADFLRKSLSELVQQGMRPIVGRLHLDRRDLLPLRDQKADLQVVLPVLKVGARVKVQLVPVPARL